MNFLENAEVFTPQRLRKLREIISRYYRQRMPDPFMLWFRKQDKNGMFANVSERILVILVDARFDQHTTAETALENTKRVVGVGIFTGAIERQKIPRLIPPGGKTAETWTDLFHSAQPDLHKLVSRIRDQKKWSALELLKVMSSAEYSVPYLAVKTSRLAVRWLHELIPDLTIDMTDYPIPIDSLVYRVASRLGVIDPYTDKYTGADSAADVKIQGFATTVFPDSPWLLDEPLWSSGRQPPNGGHCYPTSPNHKGCLFEKICPMKYTDFNPSRVGIDPPKACTAPSKT